MTNLTHLDIYTKYMIEYDKANITSSYPSLTKYEVATILDRAYMALISQKLTGNNSRRASFEYDTKAIEDLRPLVTTINRQMEEHGAQASNDFVYKLPDNMLYYLQSDLIRNTSASAIDHKAHGAETTKLVPHEIALKFKATDNNLPWVKNPVCFIENEFVHVLVDSFKLKDDKDDTLNITYIKKPNTFVVGNTTDFKDTAFELSDAAAEELIHLAVLFATENVESPRLQTVMSTQPLES